MAGTSDAEDTLPERVKHVLNWNPPALTQPPPSPGKNARPSNNTIGYSRPAAFYDKHIASHLILKHIIHLDSLVSAIGSAVHQAIDDADHPLPRKDHTLPSVEEIEEEDTGGFREPHHELGVGTVYLNFTAKYCAPIASTLAIHPSFTAWRSVITWQVDQKEAWWAIVDGALRISPYVRKDGHAYQQTLQDVDAQTITILKQLSIDSTALAIWEMKYMTVGTAEVMGEIAELGRKHAKFQWKKCALDVCTHSYERMEESKKDYDPGFDPRSTPWALPAYSLTPAAMHSSSTPLQIDPPTSAGIPSTPASAAHPPSTPLRDGLRSAVAPGTHVVSYKEASSSPMEDGEEVGRMRPPNIPDGSEYKERSKKRKADSGDEDYDPPPGAKNEVNAQSFIQQTWAEAVRSNCTIMVLHSGNHEIIGIRHRKTQTLYISDVIQPPFCSNPSYGKLQIGLYISAIKETIDRMKQDTEAQERTREAPIPPRHEEANNPDPDPDGDAQDKPSRSNKRARGSGSRKIGERKGRGGTKTRRHASGKLSKVLLVHKAKHTRLCLRFKYDIYDSPHAATFRRLPDDHEKTQVPAKRTPHFSLEDERMPPLHVIAHCALPPGATGIVHIGTMAGNLSGPTTEVAVKLAFSREEKSRLLQEYRIYLQLHSKCVQGIPQIFGLFVDEEADEYLGADKEGPYALLMSYAGTDISLNSIHQRSVKESLLTTLRSIHKAGVLHSDIRLPNICVTPSGEAIIIDFSHATVACSEEDKEQELQELSRILEEGSPTEPATKDEEKPVRRSSRIKELAQNPKVKPTLSK